MLRYGLLLDSREGQWGYYRINPQLPERVLLILPILLDALNAVEATGPMAGSGTFAGYRHWLTNGSLLLMARLTSNNKAIPNLLPDNAIR